jgi:hypothetical protein
VVDESVPRGEDQTSCGHESNEPDPKLDDLEDEAKPPRKWHGDWRLGESPIHD